MLVGVHSERKQHFWEQISAQRIGAFLEFQARPAAGNCFRNCPRGSGRQAEYSTLARAGSVMAGDRGDGTSCGQSPPVLAARSNEASGERIAERERSLGGMRRKSVLAFKMPVYFGLKPCVRDGYARADRNRKSRLASPGVLVVLPEPGGRLPFRCEFASVMSCTRNLHQLFDPFFRHALLGPQQFHASRMRRAHGARLAGDPLTVFHPRFEPVIVVLCGRSFIENNRRWWATFAQSQSEPWMV